MAQKDYVNKTGLSNFLAKLRETFAAKGHNHDDRYYTETETDAKLDAKVPTSRTVNGKALSANISLTASDVGAAAASHSHDDKYYTESEIDSKLSGKIDNTDTGLNTAINKLSTGSVTPTDDDYFISQYASGGTTTTTYHRRPVSALWTYIKGKADSTYQPKGSYATSSHTHDDRYYTETEIDTKLDGKAASSHTHTKSQITDFAHTHDDRYYTETEIDSKLSGKAASSHNHSATDITSGTLSADRLPSIPVGKLSGIIDSSNLPSYVDDVLEYAAKDNFPTKGETGKIYVDTATNLTYRWSGSAYVEISPSIALGETSSTAYRGDRGKTAYEHSQTTGNPHGTAIGDISGLQSSLDSKVPSTRKVNGKALSSDISLTASDVGASASNHTHSYLPLTGGTLTGSLLAKGTAASKPIRTRGITGVETDGTADGDLYLQYGVDAKVMLGKDGAYNISADGGTYSGTAANATTAVTATSATKATSLAPVITAGDGAAYTATVSGITALTAGANFIMMPHVQSTSTAPTLNVNGLGAKTIRVQLSNSSSTAVAPSVAYFLGANKPVRVVYNGNFWVVQLVRPDATTIYGTVAIANGGTGANTAAKALENLGAMPAAQTMTTAEYNALTAKDASTLYILTDDTEEDDVKAHIANTTVHITSTERTKWNAKCDVASGTSTPTDSTSGNIYIKKNSNGTGIDAVYLKI